MYQSQSRQTLRTPVRWQLVSTLDVGHQQAMIQECVSLYVYILVLWPVDDPSLGQLVAIQ